MKVSDFNLNRIISTEHEKGVCLGHDINLGKANSRDEVREKVRQAHEKYQHSPDTLEFTTETKESKNIFGKIKYEVIGHLKHVDNCESCDNKVLVSAKKIKDFFN